MNIPALFIASSCGAIELCEHAAASMPGTHQVKVAIRATTALLRRARSRYQEVCSKLVELGVRSTLAAATLVLLDAMMLAAVPLSTEHLVWPMAAAAAASLLRIGFSVHSLPLARRHLRS